MGKRVVLVQCSASLVLCLFFSAVSCNILWEAVKPQEGLDEAKFKASETRLSAVQKDITTPLTTVPTINFPPTSTAPVLKPNSIPEEPQSWNPFATPTTPSTTPVNPGASWCIASQTAERSALQNALDYACGKGGSDCSAIQPGGSCFYPNTLHHHASFAFNNYYQKYPVPISCNFAGTAEITSTNPSLRTCQYPSTSTSSTVLDTTDQNVSTVFGVGGPPAQPSSATPLLVRNSELFTSVCFVILLLRYGF